MPNGVGPILRKSFALVALLLITAIGIMAAPNRPQLGVLPVAGDVEAVAPYSQSNPETPPIFGPNVRANNDATVFGQHEPSLAVSRTDPNVVVVAAKDYRNGNVKQVWIDVSTDGGVTWPANRQLQIPGIPADLPIQSDPVVMARDDGRIYVACLGTNNSQNRGGIFITWTDDNGATWRNPSVPVFYPKNALDDKEWFAIDNNPASPYYHRMYMMYAPSANYIVEQHSTDGGETWSVRQTISATDTEYTYPVVASDGTVYNFMMLHWGAGRTGTVQMTKSTNGGVTWSAPSTVATALQPSSPIRSGDQFRFFAILSAGVDPTDADPNTRDLYVAWTDRLNFSTNGTDVVYVKSTNGGQTWGGITRLSHDPTGVVRDHILPIITVGGDGKVHAFWLDRRLDPTNRFFDSWYSSSTDGGATWEADTRVSTQSQDLNVGFPPGSGNAAGDYWGLDVSGNSVYVAWNDTRSGDQDILVSRGILGSGGTATPTTAPPTSTRTATSVLPSATMPPTSTRTATSTPLVTSTSGAFCPVTPTGASATCALPDGGALYSYNFGFNASCGIGGNATVRFEVAPGSGGPWTIYDTQAFRVNFSTGANTVQGFFTESSIPSQYTHYRVSISILMDDGLTTNNVTAAMPLCSTSSTSTVTSTVTRTATMAPSVTATATVCVPGTCQFVPGVTDTGNHCDDCVTALTLPFPVTFYDQIFTTANLSSNGNLQFASSNASGNNTCLPASGFNYAIMPHWDDLRSDTTGSGIFTSVSGTAPNRVLNIEWRTTYASGAGSANFEVRLYESQTRLQMVYGIVSQAGNGATIGLQKDATIFTQYGCNTGGLSEGLCITFPPVPVCPTATSTPSSTPTSITISTATPSVTQMPTCSVTYADVPADNTFYPHITYMTCQGIMSGYQCGGPGEPCDENNLPYFRPNNSVTRGQLSKIVSNAAGISDDPGTQVYEDVPPANVFYIYVQRLTNRGVMSGYPCSSVPEEPCVAPGNRPYFRPNAQATRGQISKIVANAASIGGIPTSQTFEDVPTSHTFYVPIEQLANLGVMSGYPCGGPDEPCGPGNRPYFRPNATATRGQTSKIVANTFFPTCCGRR